MAKKNVTFFCKECGYEAMGWMGKCPSCGMFNTFVEAPSEDTGKKAAKTDSPALSANSYSWTDSSVTVRLEDAGKENYKRLSSGISSLDLLFGGGITELYVTLVCGEPGIG